VTEKLHKKVSPPFEGGVVGTIYYLMYTESSFPTGVVDSRKFRRQHSIGNYIVDFFCVSEKLVIELDGIRMGNIIKSTTPAGISICTII
jgi:hypothetical protein